MFRKKRYKIRKLSNLKRRNFFDTYEPERKIRIKKQDTVPLLVRIGHRIVGLGGFIGFWAISGLMIIRGFFSAEEKLKKVRRFTFKDKVVEFRIKRQ
jgi:hypothetical protein